MARYRVFFFFFLRSNRVFHVPRACEEVDRVLFFFSMAFTCAISIGFVVENKTIDEIFFSLNGS